MYLRHAEKDPKVKEQETLEQLDRCEVSEHILQFITLYHCVQVH